jgi:bifunctional non-homologous end joining protein LigD
MLSSVGEPVRDLDLWSYEVKLDGWRAVVYIKDGRLKVRTRAGRQVTDALPELAGLVDVLRGRNAILDGELVACDDGEIDFYRLAPRMRYTGQHARRAATQIRVTLVAFDLLHLDGRT